jgi:hypothetical protein
VAPLGHGRRTWGIALTVVAEGDGPDGARWYLTAGGSAEDYYTLMETVYPDGHRHKGGMGGPALYPGNLLNVYTGRADQGPLRVVVRADPRVRRLRFQSQMGEQCDMLPVADDPAVGVTLFAILLPWATGVAPCKAWMLTARCCRRRPGSLDPA